MKRLTSGTILLGAVLAAAACNSVTDSLTGSATRIIATPTFLIVDTASTRNVLVQTFDDQGAPLIGAATVGTVTGPIKATVDTGYRPGGQPVVTQILVGGTGLGKGSFDVTANGLTTTVNADVTPPATNRAATVNNYAPIQGDTLTFTIDPGQPYRITSASKAYIGLAGTAAFEVTLVDVAADSMSARIVADSLSAGPATFTNTILNYAPTIGTFSVETDTVHVQP